MNVWLIIISVVRISSYKHDQTFDLAWTSFLQYLEPNVAILAACFTAIRSIIVRSRSQAQRVEERPTTNGLRQKFFKQRSLDCQPLNDLPNVPRAAVTGLRTDIWHGHGAGQTDTSTRDATADGHDFGGSISNTKNNIIVVKQDWSLEATKGAYPEHCASNRQFV
ncbi:MAG: hypothetical protein LQ350_003653 [Teloschistes chrysophthalmus]|nr:MAG: hypothetical protein LQ350_003653 [Niorma chrysophthalma]